IGRLLENVDVRFSGGAGHRREVEFLGNNAVVKLGLHRNGCCDIAVDEVIDEMVGLGVFPVLWMNGERSGTEWIPISLAERGKLHLGQGVKSRRGFLLSGNGAVDGGGGD